MSKTQKIKDPIAAIKAEADKARRSADKIGIMSIKSANEWVDDALAEPDPKRYFYDLLVEGECTVIIAASNTGKSIFTTQMAEAVARENVVLYLDCELSSKQFQMRYVESDTHVIHRFPDTLLRAELRPEDIVDTGLEQAILDSIAAAAEQRGIHHIRQGGDAQLQQILEKGPDDIEGEPEHQPHDQDKDRDGSVFSGEDSVQLLTADVLPAFFGLYHTLFADLPDKGKPHIRHGGASVHSPFMFHLHDDMFQHLFFRLFKIQLIQYELIAFDHLAGAETNRQMRGFGMIIDQMHNGVNAAVYRSAMIVFITEIIARGFLLIFRDMDSVIHEFVNALIP